MKLHQIVISFVIFVLTGLFFAWDALSYPMVYDDLHLIRSFTRGQLVQSFRGNWDPDHIETPGFRPLTLIFNHLRYKIFGENVIAHRLFLIFLFAIFSTTIVMIALKLKTLSWQWATMAGILCIAAKYNVIHYIWLSDGIHLVQGVCWGFSVLMLLSALDKSNFWLFSGSIVFIGLSLLVREDSLAAIPAIFFLGGYFVTKYKKQAKLHLFFYFLIVLAIFVVFMLYRSSILLDEQSPVNDLSGFFQHIVYMVGLPGISHFNRISNILVSSWMVAVIGITSLSIRETIKSKNWDSAIWLFCGIAACLSGISMVRVNLLLFPIAFFCVFLCSFADLLMKKSLWGKALAIGMIVLGVSSEIYITPIVAQNFHPYSSTATYLNGELVYGRWKAWRKAIIPLERKEEVIMRLQKMGITSPRDRRPRIEELMDKAIKDDQRTPNGENFFVPYLHAFDP